MKNTHDRKRLKELLSLPLERKVGFSVARIVEWYMHHSGDVYVSFSGGKDSTVLLYLVRSIYPDVPAVFFDTGLEYPEIREFARSVNNCEFIKPTRTFPEVVKKYGYPVVSKIVSDSVHMAKSKPGGYYAQKFDPNSEVSKKYPMYCVAKHAHLLTAPFKCTALCCKIFKKDPAKKYENRTGRKPYIGNLANESMERTNMWIRYGCNAYNKARQLSNPLSFWTTQDILSYIKFKKLKYAECYGKIVKKNNVYHTTKCDRTGCVFCLFGLHRDKKPNRIERLQKTHPKLYNYCINGGEWGEDGLWRPNKNGLGMRFVIKYLEEHYG